jgi:tetratricopeptide (TPR) repeat protein
MTLHSLSHSFTATTKVLSTFVCCALLLSACQSIDNISANGSGKKRATLVDLANERAARAHNNEEKVDEAFIYSKKQRATKLAALYQNILTLEPDFEVRTQIAYRLAQIETYVYEAQADNVEQAEKSAQSLTALIALYQSLLTQYPDRAENEEVHYQLAKALTLAGKLDESLLQIELILAKYPESKYSAELHFRRGDIYYNLQYYTKALQEYKAVLHAKHAHNYYVNSVYMTGWTLFKLNKLPESDRTFLSLLDYIIAQEKNKPVENDFSFTALNKRYVDLTSDIQRVLSISLSQQNQTKSLVELVLAHKANEFNQNNLYLYRHLLFKNLADFLLDNGLKHDAELTYQAYIALAPNNIWAARYTLLLIDLYHQQGKNQAAQQLKTQYVQQYGLQSEFWQQSLMANQRSVVNKTLLMNEILPNLITFSYQHSRYLYAKAQTEKTQQTRVLAFANTAQWLGIYLAAAKLPDAKKIVSKLALSQGLLADEMLYADASFEAHHYQQALDSYEYIAYKAPTEKESSDVLRQEAAYAATITMREILTASSYKIGDVNKEKTLLRSRDYFYDAFIEHYPNDERSLALAVKQAQYAAVNNNDERLNYFSNFVLQRYGVNSENTPLTNAANTAKAIDHTLISATLTKKAKQQVQIVSQLQANHVYQQGLYFQAEKGYDLALNYVVANGELWLEMRELLAASIYFQAQSLAVSKPLLAVGHYLRLAKKIPESSYRINAHFDAANLLFAQQEWSQAIETLLAFQQEYPNHEYSRYIPAKLAQSYENLSLWEKAAEQYLAIYVLADSDPSTATTELHREALYTAANLFFKAENLNKAISTFRTYAHAYPEPFNIAQEVRFKMSLFYQQTKEPNKEYFWYRKILEFHNEQFKPQVNMKVAVNETDARSLYLASVASLGLGLAHQQTFKQIKLVLPLKQSLARKQKAMKSAIEYYKTLLSFQLAEFVPHGTYNLAQMYRQLSEDVMSSQRPQGLDEFALEEYDLLLEEIIYPFEEKAIEIHTSNTQRAWQNVYDKWVEKSFSALAELEPAFYDRNHITTQQNKGVNVDAVRTLH